tara:strand:+ start:681 stop:1325 length:645 start_codon:yes stop_codon:yes gene_type:complete
MMNENKNTTDHNANLEMFFSRKMDIDKINRKIKKNQTVSKKKREKQLSFDFDRKQFRLVDANYVAVVSVSRIDKQDTEDLIEKYKSKIQKNQKNILKKKYELLFEYQNVEDFEEIYKNSIQQQESYIKMHEKTLENYKKEKEEKKKESEEARERILKQQEPYEIELRSNEGGDKNINKAENMKRYIEQQKQLYELACNNIIDSVKINERLVTRV